MVICYVRIARSEIGVKRLIRRATRSSRASRPGSDRTDRIFLWRPRHWICLEPFKPRRRLSLLSHQILSNLRRSHPREDRQSFADWQEWMGCL